MSKSKESSAVASVLAYMLKQNRPYSVQDVFQNMGKDFGKTAVQKAMESLTAEGKLVEKIYGKQKVYSANQSLFPVVDEAEIKAMDAKISQLNSMIKGESECVGKLETELQAYNRLITTAEAQTQVDKIYPEIDRLKEKLSHLKEGRLLISKEEKDALYKGRERYVKEWRKRKRITSDILNSILEGYPKPKKHLLEEIGIETDEDLNVKPPDS
ncbi:hypothetical protein EGW08_002593 [Elysia chlorotica]|uniref:Homologous-pairing protein 2 homolog n=1 Tax=Elysia chlorotica TaxID=188477 RepID=A0A3S1I096_ELYCH|nr:hypothetical protein EGW08_002593 [Elysia chlorotica]